MEHRRSRRVTDQDPQKRSNTMLGVWTAIGVAVGAALGVALHNLGLGIGLGLVLGIGIGIAIDRTGWGT